MILPAPSPTLDALRARIDCVGVIEHSVGSVPDPRSGHCIDDAGRALGLASRLAADPDAEFVAAVCLRQLERSVVPGRGLVLRLDADGHPTNDPLSDDGWARTLWGLALASTGPLELRDRAGELLGVLAGLHSMHPRAAAHAMLTGLILLGDDAGSTLGARLVEQHAPHLPTGDGQEAWRWPEPRLTYGDALIVEARLGLAWWREDDAAMLASLGGERRWADVVRRPSAWFEGANDLGVPVWDPTTGSAYDALTTSGVNLNQGAESTLAFIGTRYAAELVASSSPEAPRRSSRR